MRTTPRPYQCAGGITSSFIVTPCPVLMLSTQTPAQNGQLISPIVIRDDGWLVPYSYDVSKIFVLGHVRDPVVNGCLNGQTPVAVNSALNACKSLAACNVLRRIRKRCPASLALTLSDQFKRIPRYRTFERHAAAGAGQLLGTVTQVEKTKATNSID